jgi:hypothetical protein
MTSLRLSGGARFQWRGANYQITRLLPARQVNLEDLLTGTTSSVEMMTLVQALFEDELYFLTDNKPGASTTTKLIRQRRWRWRNIRMSSRRLRGIA